MDEADAGNATAELFLKDVLTHRKPEGPEATGYCLCCDEILPEGVRWCAAECRDLWSKEQNNRRNIE